MKIVTTIYLGIGFILLIICLVTFGYISQTEEVEQDIAQVRYATNVTKEEETTQKMIINMETGLRGYLLTGKENFLEPYFQGQNDFITIISRLDSLTQGYPTQNKIVQEIKNDVQLWIQDFAEPLRILKSKADQGPEHLKAYQERFNNEVVPGKGKFIIDRVRRRFAVLAKEEELIERARVKELETSILNTNIIALILTIMAIMTGVITANAIGSNIKDRIKEMNVLAQKVANGNYEVSIQDNKQDEISSLIDSLNIMAKQLQASFSHLTKVNKELDQFAYVVSHDLKAPLRAINNLAEWIAEDLPKEEPEIQHNLTLMRGRVQRMENLINGILEYSKIGRKEMPKTQFSVIDLLEDIVESLAPPSSFRINLPEQKLSIYGERTLLYQVFSNLIGNAIKYHHLPAGQVTVRTAEATDFYQFEVEDDGPGIPQEFHQKVFGVFQTMEARDIKESTGIGLAIVKKIIEEKGGKIWIESQAGQGATFIFTWPKTYLV